MKFIKFRFRIGFALAYICLGFAATCFAKNQDNHLMQFDTQAKVVNNNGQKRIIVHLMARDSVRLDSLTVPTYRFKDDGVGRFIRSLNDSIAVHDHRSWRGIKAIIDSPESAILFSDYMSDDNLRDIKGVIHDRGNKVTALYNNDEQWLNEIHVEKTDQPTTIEVRDSQWVFEGDCMELMCVLTVTPSGRVKIPILKLGQKELIDYQTTNPEFIQWFDWIKDYYRNNGFVTMLDYLEI